MQRESLTRQGSKAGSKGEDEERKRPPPLRAKEKGPERLAIIDLGPERLAIIDGTKNSALYLKILKENLQPSVCDLRLKHTWVMQQDNDHKHTSKSTS